MREFTEGEFTKLPDIIQFVYAHAISGIPIGSGIIDEAMEKYPEYFPEEIEYRRKWDLIPQEVHEQYWEAWKEIYDEAHKDLESKGIFY